MATGLITEFLGEGAAASRPATPDIPSGAVAFWYATDDNELSVYADGAWIEDIIGGGAGLVDGDYGDITVGGSGTTMSVDNGALDVANFAGAAIVTEGEGLGSSDNDTSLPTTAAVKDYVDTAVAGVGSGWTLVDQAGAPAGGSTTWTWSTNVTQVDVVGLAGFNELLILARGLTVGTTGVRVVYFSVDNGSSFYTSSGDYVALATTGAETNSDGIAHSTNSTAARTLMVHVVNTKGAVKNVRYSGSAPAYLFVASASDVNAIRVANFGGGNITAGSLYVYAR